MRADRDHDDHEDHDPSTGLGVALSLSKSDEHEGHLEFTFIVGIVCFVVTVPESVDMTTYSETQGTHQP
jgi:nitrogen-specific signal transduction histidine kinase